MMQPPSGGCVLKHKSHRLNGEIYRSHLRVAVCWNLGIIEPMGIVIAATFGWLCVETHTAHLHYLLTNSSHLRVAVCWNNYSWKYRGRKYRSHLRVAVCWNNPNNYWIVYARWRSHLRVAVCWNMDEESGLPMIARSHLRVAVCWN